MTGVSNVQTGSETGPFWMSLTGLDKLQDKFEHIAGDDLDEEMEQAAEEYGQMVMAESRRLCPYDDSPSRPASRGVHLRDTGWVSVTRNKQGLIVAQMGYSKEYAIFVHERPDLQHKSPTRYKFLEEPARRLAPQAKQKIGDGIKRVIRNASR